MPAAENTRLRKALEEIIETESTVHEFYTVKRIKEIAREALEQK